jgi:hypothetical protein
MYFNYFLKGRAFLKIFLYTRLEGVSTRYQASRFFFGM